MNALGSCRWVKGCLSQNSLPPGALLAGYDADHEEVYAARAEHEGDIVPAVFVPTKSTCSISYGGEEVPKDQFEILVPATLCWQPAYDGHVPPTAVEVGFTADGEKLYFGRVIEGGKMYAGKIQSSHGVCYYGVEGQERCSNEYECLVFA